MSIRQDLRDANANTHHVTATELLEVAEAVDYVNRADLAQLLRRAANSLSDLKDHSTFCIQEIIKLSKN